MTFDWSKGNCRDADPELFFPPEGPSTGYGSRMSRRQVEEAIAHCEFCPARDACLAFGQANSRGYGVWGGQHLGNRPPVGDRTVSAQVRELVAIPHESSAGVALMPCGTLAAARRHERAGESLDAACAQAKYKQQDRLRRKTA